MTRLPNPDISSAAQVAHLAIAVLNRLFVGFVRREFGKDAFQVERVDATHNHRPEEVRS
jgi:hypothetical protein